MTILKILHSQQADKAKVEALKLALAQETSLDLSDSKLTTKDIINLSKALKKNTSLLYLNLSSNYIEDKALETLVLVLKDHPTLTHLELNSVLVDADLARYTVMPQDITKSTMRLANLLENNNNLMQISLKNNHIGDSGFIQLGKALRRNLKLTHLNLAENSLGNDIFPSLADAVKIFASSLARNQRLTYLNLKDNYITNKECLALAKVLKVNNNLEILDLSSNAIGDEGFYAIAKALKKNHKLRTLYLEGNRALWWVHHTLPAPLMKDWVKMLKINKTLTCLHLMIKEGYLVKLAEVQPLFEVLEQRNNLTGLKLNCLFKTRGEMDKAMDRLIKILKNNPSLTSLDLAIATATLSPRALLALWDVLKTNRTLTHLEFHESSEPLVILQTTRFSDHEDAEEEKEVIMHIMGLIKNRISENKNLIETQEVSKQVWETKLFDPGLERIIGEYAGPPPEPLLKPQPIPPSFWSKIWQVLTNAWNKALNFLKQFKPQKTTSDKTPETSTPEKTIAPTQPISSAKTEQEAAPTNTMPAQPPSKNPKKST